MLQRNLTLSADTEHISALSRGRRTLFYEELAEYGARYINKAASDHLSVDAEVKYHIKNFVLLSMYFDIIFLQTACFFNVQDEFVKIVITKVMAHRTFQEMRNLGVIRICGWGGKSPREMFANALDFSSSAVDHFSDEDYITNVTKTIAAAQMTYRSEDLPDSEVTEIFRSRLKDTAIVRSANNMRLIDNAIHDSERLTGHLTAVSFLPYIDLDCLSSNSQKAVFSAFINSWCDHLNMSFPYVYTYAGGRSRDSFEHTITVNGRRLLSFLFRPQVFLSFLKKHFTTDELNRILSRPFGEIHRLRNGDWKNFCNGYHYAAEAISNSLINIEYETLKALNLTNELTLGARIWDESQLRACEFDVNSFLGSVSSVSGALLGMPFLGPAVDVLVSLFGTNINRSFVSYTNKRRGFVPPYIQKVRQSLIYQVRTV